MMEHTVASFDEDLNRLRGLISEMGGRAEQALLQAMSALNNGDLALASQVVEGDKKIDALEAEIEQLTTQTIALSPGTYFFAVSAVDSGGNESALSNEVTKTVL